MTSTRATTLDFGDGSRIPDCIELVVQNLRGVDHVVLQPRAHQPIDPGLGGRRQVMSDDIDCRQPQIGLAVICMAPGANRDLCKICFFESLQEVEQKSSEVA